MNAKILVLIILLLPAWPASADLCDGIALQVNGASKHLADGRQAKKEDFRGSNPGLGIVCQGIGDRWRSDWVAGAYRNSVYRDSVYLANSRYLRFASSAGWHADIGVALGVVTGYAEQPRVPKVAGDVGLLGYLTASVGKAGAGKINIAWLPTIMVGVNIDIDIWSRR